MFVCNNSERLFVEKEEKFTVVVPNCHYIYIYIYYVSHSLIHIFFITMSDERLTSTLKQFTEDL